MSNDEKREKLEDAFAVFVKELQTVMDGLVIDAVACWSVQPSDNDDISLDGYTTYNRPPLYRKVGLLTVIRDEILHEMREDDDG